MAGTPSRKTGKTWFEVLVSFDGLDKGGIFSQDADDTGWALRHVDTGYLRVMPEEEVPSHVRSDTGQR
jgi:hypothetical protein